MNPADGGNGRVLSARDGNPADFRGAAAFEDGGTGDEGGAGRRDIVDEPDSLSSEEIFRRAWSEYEGAGEIFFPGNFVFLA
jgi:hypothetical protein